MGWYKEQVGASGGASTTQLPATRTATNEGSTVRILTHTTANVPSTGGGNDQQTSLSENKCHKKRKRLVANLKYLTKIKSMRERARFIADTNEKKNFLCKTQNITEQSTNSPSSTATPQITITCTPEQHTPLVQPVQHVHDCKRIQNRI